MSAIKHIATAALLAAFAGRAAAACNVSGVGIAFGPYDPLSSFGTAVSGSLTVTCDQSPAPAVAIMIGPSRISGSFFPRRMRHSNGQATLAYNLFIDPQTSAVWGDGSVGTAARADRVERGKPWVVTIYGRIAGNQDVPEGVYSDSVAISVNF